MLGKWNHCILVLLIQAHDSSVRAMVWSHNDHWMLTADHGGFVKYWQSNMNNVKMYQAHKDPIRGLRCVIDGKVHPHLGQLLVFTSQHLVYVVCIRWSMRSKSLQFKINLSKRLLLEIHLNYLITFYYEKLHFGCGNRSRIIYYWLI